jgi:hypothetical protein
MIEATLDYTPLVNMYNNLFVGLILLIIGFLLIKERPFQGWLSVMFGVWLIFISFIPAFNTSPSNKYNNFVMGLLISINGLSAFSQEETRPY